MNINTAKSRLKMMLKDNKNIRRVTSNKWLVKWTRLYSYKTSDRLFSKKLSDSWKKYYLEILLDASGSMAHWHWQGTNSWFYRAIKSVKELVKLFDWVVDIDLYFFNLLETRYSTKQISSFDMSTVDDVDKCFKVMWQNNMDIDKVNHTIKASKYWDKSSCWWNVDICNIYNSFERLSKKDWEKIMIVIWDWDMHNDYLTISEMENNNYYVCWRPIKLYNKHTAKDVCKHIVKNWIHMLGITIWSNWDYSYMKEKQKLSTTNVSDLFKITLDFIKKSIK